MQEIATTFQPALHAAYRNALTFLERLESAPVGATVDAETLRGRLSRELQTAALEPDDVIEDLVRDVEGGILGMPGGRFFAWVIGGSLPAALAADWLTSAWDQNAALHACGPAAAIVEEVVGTWLKDLLRLPAAASFALVTGCQMAHVTCLAAARHALLARVGWNVEDHGLCGAPRIRVLASANRHASIDRAVRLLGIGTRNVTYLESGAGETIDAEILRHALDVDAERPTIVVLQAGDINTGVFDHFESLIPVAKQYGAWVHIDGAFGLWAAASSQYRRMCSGMDHADSWATDGHKWLNVPFDSGYAFVTDMQSHRAAMSTRAPYITQSVIARDQIDWNPEWSRRARGFATYAALRQLGRDGIAALIERTCGHARTLVTGIGNLDSAEVLWQPTLNQGLVRFRARSTNATTVEHDDRTQYVIDRVVAGGEAFFGSTNWRGMRAMRISVLNWQTSDADVARAAAAVAAALRQ